MHRNNTGTYLTEAGQQAQADWDKASTRLKPLILQLIDESNGRLDPLSISNSFHTPQLLEQAQEAVWLLLDEHKIEINEDRTLSRV